MDSKNNIATPDIARLSSQLARNNARVSSFIDSLPGSVDKLVAAVGVSDWDAVRQVSSDVARAAAASGNMSIGESARLLAESADVSDDPQQIKRRAIKLIGACGRIRPPQ